MRSLFLLMFLLPACIIAQVPTEELEQEIESVAEGNEEGNTDLIQLAENLELLRNRPLAINFATKEELQRIPYLNIFQIANLLSYRDATGHIYGAFELQMIKGFDKQTIARILPFINFNTQKTVPELQAHKIWRYSNHNILLRSNFNLQERKGFKPNTENGYLGGPANYYLRYRGRYQDLISVGFTAQQDAGEPFGGNYQPQFFDFLSGHLALQNYGNLKSFIVGDYQAEFGQGLALWSSLAFGKSAEAVEIKRYPRGFRPFTGAEENRFFRGVAGTYQMGTIKLNAFYSSRKVDANVNRFDSLQNPLVVSSLQQGGLHRTENELLDKDANRLTSMGANINYDYKNLSTGITAVNYQLELPLEAGSQPYQKFRFSGSNLSNVSWDFNYIFQDLNIYGELALSDNGATAQTLGLQSHPADGFYATLQARHFQKDYQFLYNAPFAEAGQYGETGTYLGMQWQLFPWLELKSYLDFYRFSWLSFRADAPAHGREFLAQADFYINRRFSAYFRFRHETRQRNGGQETNDLKPIPELVWQQRSNARLHAVYNLSSFWRLSSRIELSYFDEAGQSETGSVIFQDLRYRLNRIPLQLTTRLALINTSSFDTRIYAYENDLTYAFSIPPYYGRATRFYLLADWDILPRLTLQGKYAISTFYDRDQIGSGMQAIDGKSVSELRLQIRWRF